VSSKSTKCRLAVSLLSGVSRQGTPVRCEGLNAVQLLFEFIDDIADIIDIHQGKLIETDHAVFAEFAGGIGAINCALALKEAIQKKNEALPDSQQNKLLIEFV